MRAVLDTNLVIATDVPPLDGDLAISVVTIAELHFGVLVARDQRARAERLRRLSVLQRTFDPLPVDDAWPRATGSSRRRRWPRDGNHGRAPWISTAHAHDSRLYTREADDFSAFGDLVEVVGVGRDT